jgi:hypothetical protein
LVLSLTINLRLPSPTKKEGMVFEGWMDADGNMVTSDTILEKDITIHACCYSTNSLQIGTAEDVRGISAAESQVSVHS